MDNRGFDLVLYGASGFVGRQCVAYIANNAPAQLRWAITGRNSDALEAVKGETGADVEVLAADSRDQASVDRVVADARVLLSTAGPFSLYSDSVVDACVRLGTHYADITGETPWVRDLIDRYHERASAAGTRIIPGCGFDSVPSDLGAYLLVRYMQQHSISCREVRAYYQMYGGFGGGTLASQFHQQESGQAVRARDPFLLSPGVEHTSMDCGSWNEDPASVFYDSEAKAWVGRFVMGHINTRVVRRSAALFDQLGQPYGYGFRYQEYQRYGPPFARLTGLLVNAMLSLFDRAVAAPRSRRLLKRVAPKPGEGPSETTMKKGWFVCELLGVGDKGEQVWGSIQHQGDPSNRSTVKFACESALCLALEEDALPRGFSAGVLTPATALGDLLAHRLRRAGVIIEIGAEPAPRLVGLRAGT